MIHVSFGFLVIFVMFEKKDLLFFLFLVFKFEFSVLLVFFSDKMFSGVSEVTCRNLTL